MSQRCKEPARRTDQSTKNPPSRLSWSLTISTPGVVSGKRSPCYIAVLLRALIPYGQEPALPVTNPHQSAVLTQPDGNPSLRHRRLSYIRSELHVSLHNPMQFVPVFRLWFRCGVSPGRFVGQGVSVSRFCGVLSLLLVPNPR